jgi:hypothetical protein
MLHMPILAAENYGSPCGLFVGLLHTKQGRLAPAVICTAKLIILFLEQNAAALFIYDTSAGYIVG